MRVMVKRDSATSTVVDLGDGKQRKVGDRVYQPEDPQTRLRALVQQYGAANVTTMEGGPIHLEEPKAAPKAAPKK